MQDRKILEAANLINKRDEIIAKIDAVAAATPGWFDVTVYDKSKDKKSLNFEFKGQDFEFFRNLLLKHLSGRRDEVEKQLASVVPRNAQTSNISSGARSLQDDQMKGFWARMFG